MTDHEKHRLILVRLFNQAPGSAWTRNNDLIAALKYAAGRSRDRGSASVLSEVVVKLSSGVEFDVDVSLLRSLRNIINDFDEVDRDLITKTISDLRLGAWRAGVAQEPWVIAAIKLLSDLKAERAKSIDEDTQ